MLLLSPAERQETPPVTLLLTAMVNEKMDREWDARARLICIIESPAKSLWLPFRYAPLRCER